MLAYEIGAVPCWNCKSGKDRTGMLDAEIKREAINYHQGYRLSKPGAKLTNEEKNYSKVFCYIAVTNKYRNAILALQVIKSPKIYHSC